MFACWFLLFGSFNWLIADCCFPMVLVCLDVCDSLFFDGYDWGCCCDCACCVALCWFGMCLFGLLFGLLVVVAVLFLLFVVFEVFLVVWVNYCV